MLIPRPLFPNVDVDAEALRGLEPYIGASKPEKLTCGVGSGRPLARCVLPFALRLVDATEFREETGAGGIWADPEMG